MHIKGRVWRYGNNFDTDAVVPARYLYTADPAELAKHCMEDVDSSFVKGVQPGDVIVADKNFGCGSSREHAPLALKAAGISCVIAESFARIFYRNAINIGLPIMECKVEASKGDVIEADLGAGEIRNITTEKTYRASPLPPFMTELLAAGGLMPYVKKLKEGV